MRRLALFIFLSCSFAAMAQRYAFVNYNTAQGLPQSQVTAITQDDKGFLWVGTLGGLAKFNGNEFVSFTTENGILNNRISCLSAFGDEIWIGHEGGLSRIQGKTIRKWTLNKNESDINVTDIVQFNSRWIIATNGGGIYELKDNQLRKLSMQSKGTELSSNNSSLTLTTFNEDLLKVRDLIVKDNVLYLGTRAGVVRTNDLQSFKVLEGLQNYSVSSLSKSEQGLYVATFKNGLLRYDDRKNITTTVNAIDTVYSLRKCLPDTRGNLWLVAAEGVFRLKNDAMNLRLDQQKGLPMESVRCVFEDRSGTIWLGTEGKGLIRFPGEGFVYFNEQNGLSSDLIVSVNQDNQGVYWIGTFDKGIIRMGSRNQMESIVPENSATVWSSVMDVDGMNWFGTENGLIAMKGKSIEKVYFSDQGLSGDKISALLRINSNEFFAGGSDGVSHYKKGKFSSYLMKEPATVRAFCVVKKNVFCVADNGFYEIRNKQLIRIGDFRKAAFSVVSDRFGALWIGTEEGLYRYRNNRLTIVSFSPSASSNFINFLNSNGSELFVGTNNGLFVLSDLDKEKIKSTNYGISDGLVNLETNINSGFIDRNGYFWFGTASGLVKLSPGKLKIPHAAPRLVIKNILINYQEVDFRKYASSFDKSGIPLELDLPYSKNNLTFEVDGIALSNYPGLRFQFWLEGQDEGWSPPSTSTIISFNGLSAGSYILHVRCIDARGLLSSDQTLHFTVRQAFYKSWWFYLVLIIIIGFGVFKAIQFRIKRERELNEKEMLEYKSRLLALEQKSLNASMNRHFIFNSLNSIQYFINTQDRLSANRFLTNFAKLIRKNLDSSEEGNLVSLHQELERIELYLSLESMRFNERFDYKIQCDPNIDTEMIIIPAMMIQPFIENSIIHGILPNDEVKGLIEVSIDLKGNVLVVTIDDNGVGVEASMKNRQQDRGDHQSKGTEITSKRIELLKKLTSQEFELVGPVQIYNSDRSIKGTRVTLKFYIENLD